MQRLTMPTCPALNKSNSHRIKDWTNALLEQIRNVWFLVSLYLWFLEEKMVSDQHPDPKTTAEGPVEKSRYDLLVGDVLPVFLSLSSIFNRYPSCCPWSPGPASPSRPCGLPSGFWRQGVAYLLMEIWRRSLTWVWRSTSTRRPDSKVPGSHWGCGRLGCIVRAVEDIGFFCISSQKLKAKWSHLKMVIWLWLNE